MRVTQMNTKITSAPKNSQGRALNPHQADMQAKNTNKPLLHFGKDDYILLGIIAVLIWEGCEDYVLLAALGYLFFMGLEIF